MSFKRDDMLDTYLLETSQILEELQTVVLKYKDEPAFSKDAVDEIFRHMHTMKGSAGFMMFEQLNALAHKTEDVFFYIREHKPEGVNQKDLVALVLKVSDFIQGELDRLSEGEVADTDSGALIEELDEFLKHISKDDAEDERKASSGASTQIYIAPKDTKASHYFQIYITYTRDTKLANVHAYKVVHALKGVAEEIKYSPSTILSDEKSSDEILDQGFKILLKSHSPKKKIDEIVSAGYETRSISIIEIDASRFKAGFKLFGVDAPIAAKQTEVATEYVPGDFVVHANAPGGGKVLAKDSAAAKSKSNHVNIEISQMDKLSDLIMKLVSAEKKLSDDKTTEKVKKLTGDIQDIVMNMRLVPMTNIFLRMNRIIFEASRKMDKDIECSIIGDEVRADRGIVEHIADPLMHMVRNSADHGIEPSSVREAAGKPAKGKITLKAEIKNGELLVSVSDDGAGLNREKILNKAKEKGLTDKNRKDSDYTDEEVWKFITLPGFSTNANITEFSGRGVGMDVVVTSIEQIGGTLDITSKAGKGSTMTMRFPL